MSIELLRNELKNYYFKHSFTNLGSEEYRNPLWDTLDAYDSAHPGLSAVQLKAAQYEIIAENFMPIIFKNSPFYSEMGVKIAESDGVPPHNAGAWLFLRNGHLFYDINPEEYIQYQEANNGCIHLSYGPYVDYDHHCFPYSNVIENGLEHIYKQAESALENCKSDEETEFIECAKRGLLAVKKISEKFSLAAKFILENEPCDDTQKRFMEMIAKTASEVPWRKPETFYECLAAIWFLHEVCASIEGVGMYVLGRLDLMLGDLYKRDLDAGWITPDEAYDLLCRYMIYTDNKLDFSKPADQSYNLQELGEVVVLGGCDEDGIEVCNDITFMVLRAHQEQKMLYPKIHCRFTSNSNQDYLDAINRDFVNGRNVISFLNDECIIPAQVKAGKRIEDARNYVAGGCWEIMLEGCEHSAGANCYVNLTRIMDMSIHDHLELASTGVICNKLDGSKDFEEVYQTAVGNATRALRQMCTIMGKNGSVWSQVSPSPFFSACLADCLENRTDYTAGGGRYNPHGVPLGGFANFVDSLLVIRKLCFETQCCTLDKLLTAVRANWETYEILRSKVLTMPHFGDDSPESNALASRVLDDLHASIQGLNNERGGPFQLGLYIYREIIFWGKKTSATPDGRRTGDVLTQGLTPSRLHRASEITATINSGAALDLTKCPANSVLTISMPLGGVNLQTLAQLEKSFAASGLAMLQLNCVNKAELEDARIHPENHKDLIVRLFGYSAYFTNLPPVIQEEFLTRNIYN